MLREHRAGDELPIVQLVRNQNGHSYYFHFTSCGGTADFRTKSGGKHIAKALAEKGTIDRQEFLAAIALLPQGEFQTVHFPTQNS